LNRLAVLSDIHGNRWALEAVLDVIDKGGVTSALNLGDALYGPLDPVMSVRATRLEEDTFEQPPLFGRNDRSA
jgi:hypothetical protein